MRVRGHGGAATAAVTLLQLDTASRSPTCTAAWEGVAPALAGGRQLLRVSPWPRTIYRLRIRPIARSPEVQAAAAHAAGADIDHHANDAPFLPGGAAVRIALRPGPESRDTARLVPAFFAPQAAPVKTPGGAILLNIGPGGDSIEAFGFKPPRNSRSVPGLWEGYLDCFWAADDCAPNVLVSWEPALLLLESRGTAVEVKQQGVQEGSVPCKRRALGFGEGSRSVPSSSDGRLEPPAPPPPTVATAACPPMATSAFPFEFTAPLCVYPPPAPQPEGLIDAFGALMIAANDVDASGSGTEADGNRDQELDREARDRDRDQGDRDKPFFISDDMTSRLERVLARAAEQASAIASRPPIARAPMHMASPGGPAGAGGQGGRGALEAAEGNPFEELEASTLFSWIGRPEPELEPASIATAPPPHAQPPPPEPLRSGPSRLPAPGSGSGEAPTSSQRPMPASIRILQHVREPLRSSFDLGAVVVWDFGVPAPFLHVSEADRVSFVCAVEEAVGRLEAAEGAGGFEHLAMLLSDPRVLDTPLMRTLAGRESFHRALHAVRRAARRAAASDAVVASLLSAIVAAPDTWKRGEDARAMVAHCCNLCAALGIEPIMVTNDMLLIRPDCYNQLATKALRIGADWANAAPELQFEALFLQACIAFCEKRPEDCAEPLFAAWSLLLKAGLSPSRLEARVLRFLASVHLYTDRLDMADHFIDRMYWYTETDDDRMVEVDAHMSEFVRASQGKRWDAAVALAQRSLAVLEAMRVPLRQKIVRLHASPPPPPPPRPEAPRSASQSLVYVLFRARRITAAFQQYRRMVEYIRSERLHAYGDADGFNISKIWLRQRNSELDGPRHMAAADLLRTLKLVSFVMKAADPGQTTPQVAHVLWCYGDILAATGEHKGAVAALHKCLEAYARFPEHFPEDSGRIRAVRARLQESVAALKASEASG
eukprot:tig00000248_g21791.t1